MKNFVKILFLMLMTLFIVSCSSDPRVAEIAESEVMVGIAGDNAECVAKAAHKEMSDEEFDMYHGAIMGDTVGELLFAEDEVSEAVVGKHFAAAISCGLEIGG
tara:strand:+ start:24 stop:332 length:309 start_codon:yes stop_codon:yes gene_type:complete